MLEKNGYLSWNSDAAKYFWPKITADHSEDGANKGEMVPGDFPGITDKSLPSATKDPRTSS